MSEDWTPEEVAATVAEYFTMLELELRGEKYSKREHNQRLEKALRRRSAGAIEFKHANISAVLIELGFPYIDGYKPRSNYQRLLVAEVQSRLEGDIQIARAAELAVHAPVVAAPVAGSFEDVLVPVPARDTDQGRVYERLVKGPVVRRGVNYLERETHNAALGAAGESFALGIEHRRLWEAGKRHLAERIEHVSRTRGDGLGYDIHSFDEDGRDRLIEVKTTGFGAMTPFFASNREVVVSEERSSEFKLYRLFKFRDTPKLYILPGSLRESCVLDATQFRASLA